MDVVIDGYNLIGSGQGLRGSLEHKRNGLIQRLSQYQKAKGFAVTVVFDGWQSGGLHEVSVKINGITVIYSRQGEKADSVVIRVARQKGSGCVVVSSDREVRNGVEKFGATALYAGEFNEILRHMDNAGNEQGECGTTLADGGGGQRLSKTERRRREKLKKMRF